MSWVTRNQNKAYLISYYCLPPCESGSRQWSFLSLLQLFQQCQSADTAGHRALSAHLWTPAGDRQNQSSVVSFLLLRGTSGCFLSTGPLSQGFTPALAGFHPTFCCAGRDQSQAATSEVLPCIKVSDYTWLTDWSKTETFKITRRNPERESSQYGKWDLLVFQRNYAHNWLLKCSLGPHQLWDSQAERTNRSLSYHAESSFVILSDAICPLLSTTFETLHWNPTPPTLHVRSIEDT